MYNPPQQIKVISDDNELQFTKTEKTKSDILFYYTYVKSFCFLGDIICFNEKELCRLLIYSFKVIE